MHYETIIIGGGPAGLACAEALAAKGVETLLLERKKIIGPKVCAGGITWSGAAQQIPDHIIEKKFLRQHITSKYQKVIIEESKPIISTVDRENLGQWMAAKAKKSGAIIKTGEKVIEISENELKTEEKIYRFNYLVGADGSNSLVRRFLKIPVDRFGVGIHYQIPESYPDMVWHLDSTLFKSGYGWIFPHREKTSVGAYGWQKDIMPSRLKKGLHSWMKKQGIDRRGLAPRAALINFDYRGWQFGNKFLVGDAAGLASGVTGEGIYSAIFSGEEVARHIVTKEKSSNAHFSQLLKKHELHTKLLKIIGRNELTSKILPELLIFSLKMNLLNYRMLELGSHKENQLPPAR